MWSGLFVSDDPLVRKNLHMIQKYTQRRDSAG
jgi:hypothetical protein